jgi:hypothetical protein
MLVVQTIYVCGSSLWPAAARRLASMTKCFSQSMLHDDSKLHGRSRVAPCRAFVVVCNCPRFLIVDYLFYCVLINRICLLLPAPIDYLFYCVLINRICLLLPAPIESRERYGSCWLCRPSMFVAHAVDVALVDVEQTRSARACFFPMLGIVLQTFMPAQTYVIVDPSKLHVLDLSL